MKAVRPDELIEKPKIVPPGCLCNPLEWFDGIIDPICDSFAPMEKEPELCVNCQHERGCHE
jgi:hypothetical protein